MLLRLAWRNVWRNRLRSSIMLAAMVFGLLGAVLMSGFVIAMTKSMIDNAIKYQTANLQIHSAEFIVSEELAAWLPDADGLAIKVRQEPGVAAVSVRQLVDGMLASAASTRGVRINGIDLGQEVAVTALKESLAEGVLLPSDGRNPIIVSQRNAERLNLKLGSKVVLTFTDAAGEVTGAAFRVCGFFKTPLSGFDDANVFVRRSDLAGLTGLDQAHEIAIRLEPKASLDQVKMTLTALVGERAVVRDWGEVQPVLAAMTGSVDQTNTILAAVFMAALGFGIVNIMLMSVFERTREFGVLMATGMTKAKVLALIVIESLFLGGSGGLLGMAVSWLVLALLGRVGLPFGAMAEGLGVYGVGTVLYPEVPLSYYLWMFALVLVTSLLAALYPARQILKKRPVEALAERH
jgi:putative ABC transport system permease protein